MSDDEGYAVRSVSKPIGCRELTLCGRALGSFTAENVRRLPSLAAMAYTHCIDLR